MLRYREAMFLENTPTIILFWIFITAIFILMVVSIISSIIIHKKSKEKGTKQLHLIEKICLALSIICSIPICIVIGYILYLYIG